MSVERNKATFERYIEEVGNRGDLDLVGEIFDRYVAHRSDGGREERGPEDVRWFMGEFRRALPDFHTEVEFMVGEGDMVATRWRASGTHRGEFRGVPPTGRELRFGGIGIFRFSEEGRVVESWDSLDELGMLRQMGAIEEKAQPANA